MKGKRLHVFQVPTPFFDLSILQRMNPGKTFLFSSDIENLPPTNRRLFFQSKNRKHKRRDSWKKVDQLMRTYRWVVSTTTSSFLLLFRLFFILYCSLPKEKDFSSFYWFFHSMNLFYSAISCDFQSNQQMSTDQCLKTCDCDLSEEGDSPNDDSFHDRSYSNSSIS